MRRRLFLLLLAVALGTWGWALWRTGLFGHFHEQNKSTSQSHAPQIQGDLSVGKDLFRGPWTPAEAPAVRRGSGKGTHPLVAPAPPVPKEPTTPPPELGGFLGGDPPMAILRYAGKTELVHPGSAAFGWMVLSVAGGVVEVEKDGVRRRLGP